jgi:hypothetical protein
MCDAGDCNRPPIRDGLCAACIRAKSRNGTTERKVPLRGKRHTDPRARACEAVEGLWDVLADEEPEKVRLHRAWLRFLYAWRDYRRPG